MIGTWLCTLPDGTTSEELVVRHGAGSGPTLLIIPPLFSEHNLLRRFLVEVMRALAEVRIDTVLPDLPGWNESLAPLEQQTFGFWRTAMAQAAEYHEVTHVLAMRSGALLVPPGIGGWVLAPQSGAKLLRAMVRARTIASREAGTAESSETLYEMARVQGITLAGWPLGATMVRELEAAEPVAASKLVEIAQTSLGGPGLWLRAEPGEDAGQAARLADLIAAAVAGAQEAGA